MSAEAEIQPAMTAQEWDDLECEGAMIGYWPKGAGIVARPMLKTGPEIAHEIIAPHPVAAFCLLNQPFGFKLWMVGWLKDRNVFALPKALRVWNAEGAVRKKATARRVDRLIADRIKALLPLREATGP